MPGKLPLIVLSLALPALAAAPDAAPVRQIAVYVQPYYAAAEKPGDRPQVKVGAKFDALLASNRKADIVAARDLVLAEPQRVTPMTMMVVAIRLYDVGLRDDAVFWFYVAKDRYFTVRGVLDVNTPALAQVEDAVRNFATLAGPAINGYAFCDLAKQQEARRKSIAWVEKNRYEALFTEQLPARPGNRAENLRKALEGIRDGAERERRHLEDPKNRQELAKARKDNQVDARFCWAG